MKESQKIKNNNGKRENKPIKSPLCEMEGIETLNTTPKFKNWTLEEN